MFKTIDSVQLPNLKEKLTNQLKRLLSTFADMKTLQLFSVSLLIVTNLSSCIDYHPYDVKISGEHNLTGKNINLIEKQMAGCDSMRFVLISDTQRWYDETNDAVESINARNDIDFVIHCGDISDFGLTKEFELQRDILQKLEMPYVVLLGNHDCLGTGEDAYVYIFGNPDFSFTAGDTHFVCLNTNAFEYDYSTAIPDFSFISSDRDSVPINTRRTIVAMHAQPTSEQFNNNVSEIFEEEINEYPNLTFCMCGHGHHTQVNILFDDGIPYYEVGAAKMREYIVFTLKKDGGYSYEVVSY